MCENAKNNPNSTQKVSDFLAGSPRHRRVLELVAEKSGWGTPCPEDRHRGLAVYFSFGSWVAEVAEISLLATGEVRVHRVVCAVDCGSVVNPDTVASQMEGAIVYGLTAALKGEVTIRDGGVAQDSFRDYPLLAMAEMPTIDVHIVPTGEPPGGVGEPGAAHRSRQRSPMRFLPRRAGAFVGCR
jgi:isoquinoline 1-oxidoreductase beta subunit